MIPTRALDTFGRGTVQEQRGAELSIVPDTAKMGSHLNLIVEEAEKRAAD